MALCWSLAHALATPQGIRERSLAPGLAESPGSVRADSSVVGSTQLWAPQAPESDDGYVAVQLREELPLLGPDWDDGATIGELQAWVSSALFDAAPLLSPSRTRGNERWKNPRARRRRERRASRACVPYRPIGKNKVDDEASRRVRGRVHIR